MSRDPCIVAIHQPEWLPWLGFLDKLRQCDVFVLLDQVQFEKHYYQNRNRVRTATPRGWTWLTVPVRTKGRFGQPIGEVEIDYATDWRRTHLRTLELNYHKAPAFDACWPALQALYERPWERLADASIAMIHWLADQFGIRTQIIRSSALDVSGSRSALLLAICRQLGATEYLSGVSGREYLQVGAFEEAGIRVRCQEFHHPVYRQCYEPFVPALSSVDLLLHYGAQASDILVGADTPRLSELFT